MSKIVMRLSTAAATVAVTGGLLFAGAGAASATTYTGQNAAVSQQVVRHDSAAKRWDGQRWWFRYSGHGDWYSFDHGVRYRYDGHRFYRWSDGKWKAVSASYARRHDLYRHDFFPGRSPRGHHGADHGWDRGWDRGGHHGKDHDHGKGHNDHDHGDHHDGHSGR